MADPVKRLHFFTHQYLRAEDFADEQNYHIQRWRDHNRSLHTAGIAEKLEVPDPPAGSTAVTINAGVAYDGQGREVVLSNNTPLDLEGIEENQSVYITISYGEKESDPTEETGAHGNTRWTEEPLLEALLTPPNNPSEKLVLAKVNRTGKTIASIDRSERRTAGVVAGDLKAPSLTLTDTAIAADKWLRIDLGAEKRADVLGSLRVTENFSVEGNVGIGMTNPQAKLEVNGTIQISDDRFSEQYWWMRGNNSHTQFVIGNTSDKSDGNIKFTITDNGNVGIGTTNPQEAKVVVQDKSLLLIDVSQESTSFIRFGDQAVNDKASAKIESAGWGILHGGFRFIPRDTTNNQGKFIFSTGGNDDPEKQTSLLTVQENGNVGIGTTNPDHFHLPRGASGYTTLTIEADADERHGVLELVG